MKLDNIRQIGIIGAGTMGNQLAQLFSHMGKYQVIMSDINEQIVDNGLKAIEYRLQRYFVDKGKMQPDEMSETMARVRGTAKPAEAAKNADFIVEAVIENMGVKKDIFRELDASAPADCILASNTSGLSITEMAGVTKRPDKVIGTHFFNPVAVMRLVEVVKGALTSDDTVAVTCALMAKVGKETVICRDVSHGFLANRAYAAMVAQATQMVWERVASPQDIDKALKLGYNLPMGPLEVYDMTGGWAIGAASEQDIIKEIGPEGRLHPLVRLMVRAGYTGGIGKKGIYDFWNEVLSKW